MEQTPVTDTKMTLNFSPTLMAVVGRFAEKNGTTKEDAVEDLLRRAVAQLSAEERQGVVAEDEAARLQGESELLDAVDAEVDRLKEDGFGEDVINEVLSFVRDDETRHGAWLAATSDGHPGVGRINRRLGSRIRRRLATEVLLVEGKRVIGNNPAAADRLNKTWTKLVPGKGSKS